MNTIKKYRNVLIIIGILILVAISAKLAFGWKTGDTDKVALCHKTHSETNPFVVQVVDANEVQSHEENGDFLYQGSFGIHTEEARDWCKDHQPKLTPTPTSKKECEEDCVTPTPKPTLNPCEGNLDVKDEEIVQVCITPTATPSATLTPVQPTATPEATLTPTSTPQPESNNNQGGSSSSNSTTVNVQVETHVTLPPCNMSNCGWK